MIEVVEIAFFLLGFATASTLFLFWTDKLRRQRDYFRRVAGEFYRDMNRDHADEWKDD